HNINRGSSAGTIPFRRSKIRHARLKTPPNAMVRREIPPPFRSSLRAARARFLLHTIQLIDPRVLRASNLPELIFLIEKHASIGTMDRSDLGDLFLFFFSEIKEADDHLRIVPDQI